MAYTPEQFSRDIKEAAGNNLMSVVLYGSAAGEGYSNRYSDFNIMVLLEAAGIEELKKIAPLIRRWTSTGNPAPLLMTREGVSRSTDIFPLEFLDIRHRHITLLGDDPIAELEFSTANLRLELEREMKGKYLHLRSAYLQSGGGVRHLQPLLARSIPVFFVFFRGVLWMMGRTAPYGAEELIRDICQVTGADEVVFRRVWALRADPHAEPLEHLESLTGRYLEELNKVVMYIDQYQGGK
jgi:hypothetical protein